MESVPFSFKSAFFVLLESTRVWLLGPFTYEHGGLLFIIFYLAFLLIGKTINKNKFKKLEEVLFPVIDSQFAALGFDKKFFIEDSMDTARLYASGRRNCRGLICFINLLPRQDLYYFLYQFYAPKDDTIV